MIKRSKKLILALVSVLCLCLTCLMPLAIAAETASMSGTEKAIFVTLWTDEGEEKTLKYSLEDMAKECGNGTTWDRVPWNSFYSYFRDRYQGTLQSDDVAFVVRPHEIALYEVDSKTQTFRPGMQVYIYPKSDLIQVNIMADGDDCFFNFYQGEVKETILEKTVYLLKGGTQWGDRTSNPTWGEFIDDFLLFYELNDAVERGGWYFKSGTILGAKLDMEKPVDRNPSEPSEPVINIGPGMVDTERPNFVIKSYIRYYNGLPIDESVFALEGGGGVWSTPVAHYEMKKGHDGGLDEYKRVNEVPGHAAELTARRAIINNSGHHFNAGIFITILPIPVVVEVGDAIKSVGAADPTFTATVRLDEDALLNSFPDVERFDEVSIETMKALIEKELGNSFFTFERDAGEANGEAYEIRAVQKEGVNPYSDFQIRYVPGELKVSDDSDLTLVLSKQLTDSEGNLTGDGKPFGVHLYDENKNLITSVVLKANSDTVQVSGLQSGKTYYIVEEDRDYYTIEGYDVFETELQGRKAVGIKVAQLPEGVSGTVRVQVNNSTSDVILIPDEITPLAPGVPDDVEIIEIEADPVPLTGQTDITMVGIILLSMCLMATLLLATKCFCKSTNK